MSVYDDALKRLKSHAELDHVNHPQYKGHYDNHQLGLILKNSGRFKSGSYFMKHDWVLFKYCSFDNSQDISMVNRVEVYCPQTGVNCILGADYVKPL